MRELTFRHFATGWQVAEDAFLQFSNADADIEAEFFGRLTDEVLIGMLEGVDSTLAEDGITGEAECEVLRQAAIHGFSARWQQLLGTAQAGGRA